EASQRKTALGWWKHATECRNGSDLLPQLRLGFCNRAARQRPLFGYSPVTCVSLTPPIWTRSLHSRRPEGRRPFRGHRLSPFTRACCHPCRCGRLVSPANPDKTDEGWSPGPGVDEEVVETLPFPNYRAA